uniref:Uncharacterized protein n=1 Tax=Plectus sambesii TaxID=2011161 RepID=A0A914W348_9BILA
MLTASSNYNDWSVQRQSCQREPCKYIRAEDVFEPLRGAGRRKARAGGDRRRHLLLSVRHADVRDEGCSTGVTENMRNALMAIAPIYVALVFRQSQVLGAVNQPATVTQNIVLPVSPASCSADVGRRRQSRQHIKRSSGEALSGCYSEMRALAAICPSARLDVRNQAQPSGRAASGDGPRTHPRSKINERQALRRTAPVKCNHQSDLVFVVAASELPSLSTAPPLLSSAFYLATYTHRRKTPSGLKARPAVAVLLPLRQLRRRSSFLYFPVPTAHRMIGPDTAHTRSGPKTHKKRRRLDPRRQPPRSLSAQLSPEVAGSSVRSAGQDALETRETDDKDQANPLGR